MKGVILAAGKGSRLYPVTHHVAKPLLPLANRPTLEYAFDKLHEIGVREVAVVVGENERQMKEAMGSGKQYGLRLTYVRQSDPKGLAHALGFAQEFCGTEEFVMYLGDGLYSHDFHAMADQFLNSDAANLNLVAYVDDPRRFGVANLDGDRIVKLVEKPQNPESNWAMAGVYFFRPAIWSILPDLEPSARGEYEITDAIQMLIDRGHTVLAGKYPGSWFDTGTLPSFLETTRFLVEGSHLIDPTAAVAAEVGANVVVGPGAFVECTKLVNSVILPGAHVNVGGTIEGCVLGGWVEDTGSLHGQIQFGARPLPQ